YRPHRPPGSRRLPRRGHRGHRRGPGPRGGHMTEQAMEPGTRPTARPVLKIDGLVAGYGGGDVLRGVSLEVAEGGITCVVGPNGAGKSTLMATISGLLRPLLGSVLLDGDALVCA